MKSFNLTAIILLLSIATFGQTIKTEEDVNLIKSQIDKQTNLKVFPVTPTLFNNKGETHAGKFSYNFIYDASNTSLVKIDIINSETREIQTFYFSNDQLVLVYATKETEYFFDLDFDIPYWGKEITKSSIKRDKLKETAYTLLISFKKKIKKGIIK